MRYWTVCFVVGCAAEITPPDASDVDEPSAAAAPEMVVSVEAVDPVSLRATFVDADGRPLVEIETFRGPAVDKARLDMDPSELPDHVVFVRMTLPTGQVVYEDRQTDLPLVGDADWSWAGEAAPFTGEPEPMDLDLLSMAAADFAAALEHTDYSSEQTVLESGAAALWELDNAAGSGAVAFDPAGPRPPPSCSGYSCDGKDPVSAGCDATGITAASVRVSWVPSQFVQLRYSTACGTNWGRFTSSWTTVSTVYVQRRTPAKTLSWRHTGTLNYTDMLYCKSPCLARAYVNVDGRTHYTGYY